MPSSPATYLGEFLSTAESCQNTLDELSATRANAPVLAFDDQSSPSPDHVFSPSPAPDPEFSPSPAPNTKNCTVNINK